MIVTARFLIAALGQALRATVRATLARRDAAGATRAFDAELLQVSFPARDGRARVDGWYLQTAGGRSAAPAPGPAPALVLMQGRRSGRGDGPHAPSLRLAQSYAAEGFAVLMIDPHGQGNRRRDATDAGERERFDVLGAVDWLRERGHRRIGVLRSAKGAAVVLQPRAA